MLEALLAHDVRFVVVGMLAGTLQGAAVMTDDLDICPDRSEANLERLTMALRTLDAKEWDPRKGEAVGREWSVAMLQVDRTWVLHTKFGGLDILFEPAGTGGYDDLANDGVVVAIDSLEVPVASLASVIRMKEAAGRDKDRAHVMLLRSLQRELEQREPKRNL